MGLTECIAGSAAEYVQRATRIATDADYRRRLRRAIGATSPVLFEDPAEVRALDAFFTGRPTTPTHASITGRK
jgi:predicted O-linked N-acetylglucosamine transferase (SPINDLY family)